jgi:phosphatidylglycerophosphate synthase
VAVTEIRVSAPALAGPRRGAAAGLAVVVPATALVLLALPFERAIPPWVALATLLAIAIVLLDRVALHHPHPRFGLGNAITLARAGGTAVFVALALESTSLSGSAAWLACAGVGLLLGLDAIDGRIARRQGLASAFGARFDMEIDALLILALAALAAGLGKAGPWILGLGLIRYAFVLAGWLHPALAQPLPPSRRRAAICGVQVAVLGLLLAPPVIPPLSILLAACAFAALVGSFAVDIAWLLRGRG